MNDLTEKKKKPTPVLSTQIRILGITRLDNEMLNALTIWYYYNYL